MKFFKKTQNTKKTVKSDIHKNNLRWKILGGINSILGTVKNLLMNLRIRQ